MIAIPNSCFSMIFMDPKIYTISKESNVNIRLDPDDDALNISGAWMDFSFTIEYIDETHD